MLNVPHRSPLLCPVSRSRPVLGFDRRNSLDGGLPKLSVPTIRTADLFVATREPRGELEESSPVGRNTPVDQLPPERISCANPRTRESGRSASWSWRPRILW